MTRLLFLKSIACLLLLFRCVSGFSSEENFLFINGKTGEKVIEFGPHIDEQITPASTFKIALSLMGYETGILHNETEPVWDFQEDYDNYLAAWEAPQSPQSWMNVSCVWYSRLLASQLGSERIQKYLAEFDYGNQDMSGGITKAWLDSSLKISPKEQVVFIQNMLQGKLPISNYACEITKALLFKEELPEGWKLYEKSGLKSIITQDGADVQVGWIVGWIEKDHIFFPFAYNKFEEKIMPEESQLRVNQLLMEFIISHTLLQYSLKSEI